MNRINTTLKNVIKSIPASKANFDDKGRLIPKSALEYAKDITKGSKYNIASSTGSLWIYYQGVHTRIDPREKGMNFVKNCMAKIDGGEYHGVDFIVKVYNELLSNYHELIPYKNSEVVCINLQSNVLGIHKDGSIDEYEHEEDYNFTYKLKFDYNKKATCPIFDKFLQTSLGDSALIDVLGEYLGYVLNGNAKNHEKALFMYGDGSNGKSTLINIITALFGGENISVVELTEMGDMLKCALMDGKLLNISSDAKKNGLDTSAFKKIVSGEPILGKRLFKDIYTITNLPKLIVAMNRLPYHSGDNSHGYYRRLLLMPFTRVIKEEDKDYELEAKIIANELPGILNFAIKGMQRLSKQGAFTKAKAMTEALDNYKESANYVATFLEEEQYEVVDASTKEGTSLRDLYGAYKDWCSLHGYNPFSATYLSSELNNLGCAHYKSSTKHYRLVKKQTARKLPRRV